MAKKPNIKDANLSFRNALSPLNKSRIEHLVQHHMVHKTWHIQDVHKYHRDGNGWAGIGYNFWIDFEGNIYEGRGFNQGAHVSGHNATSIGIGYQGDFTTQDMPDAQLQAGIELNNWLMSELGLSKSAIVGHNKLGNTACPGKNFRMNELKGGKTSTSGSSSSSWNSMTNSQQYADATKAIRDAGLTVTQYQQRLINAGHNLPKFGADGTVGAETLSATKSFQREYSLSSSSGNFYGRPGPTTIKKLNEVSSTSKQQVHLPATANTWRTYKLNVQPVKANSDWSLTPAAFGGLTYDILDEPYPGVVTINTGRGKRNIYVQGTSATIS